MPILLTLTDAPKTRHDCLAYPGGYDDRVRRAFSAMPGPHWQKPRRCYRGAREAIDMVAATLIEQGVVRLDDQRSPAPSPPTLLRLDDRLRRYQVSGSEWIIWQLAHSRAALLADEMGLGKTAQAITALDAIDATKSVQVVAPAVVVKHWEGQLRQWSKDPYRYHVLSYEKAARAIRRGELPHAWAVVLDEIHYLMNSASQRSKAIRQWLNAHPVRPYAIGLSGTPMTARIRDLHNPFDTLWPGRFGRWFDFTRRYCGGRYEEIPGVMRAVWKSDGRSNEGELSQRVSACMLRRTKQQVGDELPSRTRIVIDVELPPAAKRDSKRAAKALNWDATNQRTSIAALLSGLEEYKLDTAVEIAEQASRPLVLTTRKATAKELGVRLDCPYVTGETPADKRASTLLTPESGPGVATVYSITTGIDLIAFDTVVFVGLDWLPSILLQAEARVHRMGQSKPVTIYYLCGLGTLDEVVRDRVIDRLHTFAEITQSDGDETQLANDLADASEEDLIISLVAAAKGKGRARK